LNFFEELKRKVPTENNYSFASADNLNKRLFRHKIFSELPHIMIIQLKREKSSLDLVKRGILKRRNLLILIYLGKVTPMTTNQ